MRKSQFLFTVIILFTLLGVGCGSIMEGEDKDLQTPEAFLKKWELKTMGNPVSFNITVPEDWEVIFGQYPEGLYWGLANVFSKEVELDLTNLKGKNVEVLVYELEDGLPRYDSQSEFRYPSTATILVKDSNTVGAWLNFNINNIGPSVNMRTLDYITGLTLEEWIERENYFTYTRENEDLKDLSPIEVLEVFFEAINNGDKERAISCFDYRSQLGALTTNKDKNELYNPGFGSNNSMVYNILEAHPKSYKLLDPDNLSELEEIGDRKKIEIQVETYIKWRDDAFNSPDFMQTRFAILNKTRNGWKIEGLGTGP